MPYWCNYNEGAMLSYIAPLLSQAKTKHEQWYFVEKGGAQGDAARRNRLRGAPADRLTIKIPPATLLAKWEHTVGASLDKGKVPTPPSPAPKTTHYKQALNFSGGNHIPANEVGG